jgi:hypothetical protein
MLFSDRSIWTMVHGVVLSGGALMALSAALFTLATSRPAERADHKSLAALLVSASTMLWLAVLVGTYVIFPMYRAPAPADVGNLVDYPRALLLGNSETAWLHSFAMETKEHVPWIAAMLATAVAFVAARRRQQLAADLELRRMATALLAICFALVAFAGLLGVFVNKVAPLH